MAEISTILSSLNPQQRKAVETLEGPVLVVAGPGTGKTFMLASRIANILASTDVRSDNILCLTFTEAGVTAMRQKLHSMIGDPAYYVKVATFHGFANEVIQANPDKFAFSKELEQLDDLGAFKMMREIIEELASEGSFDLIPFHNKYQYQGEISKNIQVLKREAVSPERLKSVAEEILQALEADPKINSRTKKPTDAWQKEMKSAKRNIELAAIYARYQEKLLSAGKYDYEDMIMSVIERFESDDELLAYYQEKYLYILVDEYQDTNGSQNQIIKHLGSFDERPNIFAVGDDDQAIYRFQGANVENLLFFEKQFKDVTTIPVTINYRSSQLVLDSAESVIEHNENRLTKLIPNLVKHLVAGNDIPEHKIQVYKLSSYEAEINCIVKKIKELEKDKVDLSDIAILYRKHSDSEDLINALIKHEIPVNISAGSNALLETPVKQLVDLLTIVGNLGGNTDELLAKALWYGFFDLKRLDLYKFLKAQERGVDIWEILQDIERLKEAEIQEAERFKNIAGLILKWRGDATNMTVEMLLETIMTESGLLTYYFQDGKGSIEEVNALKSFFNYFRRQNRASPNMQLSDLLADLSLLSENRMGIEEGKLAEAKHGVQLMTAHGAKGLEFKHVFIIQCVEGNWGGNRSRESIKLPSELFDLTGDKVVGANNKDLSLEDERRLFFVALTRSKEHIYITLAEKYPSGNSTTTKAPSKFLSEIPSRLVEYPDTSAYEDFDKDFVHTELSPIIQLNYNDEEKMYLSSLVSDFKLSASALNEYIECPLKFKFNRLLKMPRATSRVTALGSAVHSGLERLLRAYIAEGVMDKELLLQGFRYTLDKQLLSKTDKEETRVEGERILSEYFEYYKDSMEKPLFLEYGFGGKGIVLQHTGLTEPVALSGKIDKVELLDKEMGSVKIVDYKTSSPKSENAIKGLTKDARANAWNQLVFYKLITGLDSDFRDPKTGSKYVVTEGMIDFLKKEKGSYKQVTLPITDRDVDNLVKTIVEVMGRIRLLEFGGSASFPLCGECEYCKMINSRRIL